MLASKLLMTVGGEEKLFVDDCFACHTYVGNGATQTINNGIDLAGKGGMVWLKGRTPAYPHYLHDTLQTPSTICLSSNDTSAQSFGGLGAFTSSGFSLDSVNAVNQNGLNYASWTFRKAPKFFLNTTVTKSTGSNATVDLSSLGTVGMVMVKRTDSAGSWYVFHRSATAGKLLYLEQTAAEATLGHITVSGTTLTLVNGVIADGSYVVYAWAHDPRADGIIQCGSFTTDMYGELPNHVLGWEPQYLMVKTSSGVGSWSISDIWRGMPGAKIAGALALYANTVAAEVQANTYFPTSTGFGGTNLLASTTYIYLAIRRSNKPPTLGTQVYNAIARTGTSAAATVTGVGFAPDLCITKKRSATTLTGARFTDRLRGKTAHLDSTATTAEVTTADTVSGFDVMDGFVLGADATTSAFNTSGHTYVNHFFKRALEVNDVVCYEGTGVVRTVNHNLGAIPELIIVKNRGVSAGWLVFGNVLGSPLNDYLVLSGSAPKVSVVNFLQPATLANFGFGTGNPSDSTINANTNIYVAYLFATKSGISKVGSYTGNGTSQTINCGFTTGARFILIKRTDATGSWYVWDSVRGIVAGNDPHLSLNTTAAEVTTYDSIDPNVVGFDINQVLATNINVNTASYIFLAFS